MDHRSMSYVGEIGKLLTDAEEIRQLRTELLGRAQRAVRLQKHHALVGYKNEIYKNNHRSNVDAQFFGFQNECAFLLF